MAVKSTKSDPIAWWKEGLSTHKRGKSRESEIHDPRARQWWAAWCVHCWRTSHLVTLFAVVSYSCVVCIMVTWRLHLGDYVLATASWRLRLGDYVLATTSWRLRLGDYVSATMSWRLRLSDYALATMPWRLRLGDCVLATTSWRLHLNNFTRVLCVARTEQIGDSLLLATRRPRAIAVAAVSLCMRAHASHCPTH